MVSSHVRYTHPRELLQQREVSMGSGQLLELAEAAAVAKPAKAALKRISKAKATEPPAQPPAKRIRRQASQGVAAALTAVASSEVHLPASVAKFVH